MASRPLSQKRNPSLYGSTSIIVSAADFAPRGVLYGPSAQRLIAAKKTASRICHSLLPSAALTAGLLTAATMALAPEPAVAQPVIDPHCAPLDDDGNISCPGQEHIHIVAGGNIDVELTGDIPEFFGSGGGDGVWIRTHSGSGGSDGAYNINFYNATDAAPNDIINDGTTGFFGNGLTIFTNGGDIDIDLVGDGTPGGTVSGTGTGKYFSGGGDYLNGDGVRVTQGEYVSNSGGGDYIGGGNTFIRTNGDIWADPGIFADNINSGTNLIRSYGDIHATSHGIAAYSEAGQSRVYVWGSIDANTDASGGADGIHIEVTGSGAATARTLSSSALITTTGDDAAGIDLETTSGYAWARSSTITTQGEDSDGIEINTTSGNVRVDADSTIRTYGESAEGIDVETGSGNINIDVRSVSTFGDDAEALQIDSDSGNVDIDVYGDIYSKYDAAIDVETDGRIDIWTGGSADIYSRTDIGILAVSGDFSGGGDSVSIRPHDSVYGYSWGIDAASYNSGSSAYVNVWANDDVSSYSRDAIWAGNTGTGGVNIEVDGGADITSKWDSAIEIHTGGDATINIGSGSSVTGYGDGGSSGGTALGSSM